VLASLAAAQPAQRSFDSPEAAVEALVGALEAGDNAALTAVLGPETDSLIDSGDGAQNSADKTDFLAAYGARHSLVADGNEQRTLVIGENDWPFPVPVVRRNGSWLLDGEAGIDELIYRRIGANELGAIAVTRGYVEAQREYAAAGHDEDPAGIYALKLVSDEERHNGLYWPTAEGEPPSPAGPAVAAAAAEGYRRSDDSYHGYRYRMLYRQGSNAEGGAKEYFENGVLTGGFALVAWPADYGATGIMTFIVNQDGGVFQKDLGDDTDAVVNAMNAFDPDSSWDAVEPPEQ
jgi:hypothetical protein